MPAGQEKGLQPHFGTAVSSSQLPSQHKSWSGLPAHAYAAYRPGTLPWQPSAPAASHITGDKAHKACGCPAGIATFLTWQTGSGVWDALGSITIGILLGVTAVFLIQKNRQLLIGEPAMSCTVRCRTVALDSNHLLKRLDCWHTPAGQAAPVTSWADQCCRPPPDCSDVPCSTLGCRSIDAGRRYV